MNVVAFLNRALLFVLHGILSVGTLILWRMGRGGSLVFTHAPDLDSSGRDGQMGPLVEALRNRGRLREVTLVPLTWNWLLRNWRAKRRPFVSHASILGTARLLAPWNATRRRRWRQRIASFVLSQARVNSVFLIDESGSGQSLLKAARSKGIPVLGIQHGDFHSGNHQYDSAAGGGVEPADVLCVWSHWFRARLLALSRIYDENNTVVTGRMRAETRPARPRIPTARLAVLFLGEAHSEFFGEARPFWEALMEAEGLQPKWKPHPSSERLPIEDSRLERRPLWEALNEADVVVGRDSSALLEAVHQERPVVLFGNHQGLDRSGYGDQGIGTRCEESTEIVATCRKATGAEDSTRAGVRKMVWGQDSRDPVAEILAVEAVLRQNRP